MAKSIKQQYIDLKEGKMSQSQFMRNVRITLPQFITNITSFSDTVKILKNKAILTEADIKEHQDSLTINDKSYSTDIEESDIYGIAGNPEEEADRRAANTSIKPAQTPEDKYNVDKKIDQSELNFLKKLYAKNPTTKIKQMIDYLENRISLQESYKNFNEIDTLNGQEVLIGINCEIKKDNKLTKKEAAKIVIKNLKKDPFYYTNSAISGDEGYELKHMSKIKPGSDQMQDVKKDNNLDKANSMSLVKGIEKISASSNKSKKETNKPVSNIKMMSLISKSTRGVKKMEPTGEKMKKISLKENEEINKLRDMLEKHDWFYMMSDDNEKYNKYKIEHENIKALARSLGQEGMELYDEYSKKAFPNSEPLEKNEPKTTSITKKKANPKLDILRDKIQNLMKENEIFESMDLETAKAEAQQISEEEGVVQHVNELPNGGYTISNWYDSDNTVISYENGMKLNENIKEAKAGSLSVGDKFKIGTNLGKFIKDEEVEVISLEPFGDDIKLVLSNGKDEDDFYLDKNDEI
jgi:hypothetical protein